MTGRLLADLPDRQAGRADTTPIVFGGTAYPWSWLTDTSNRVAQALLAAGVRPGDRLALLDANSPAFFAVLFGAAKARATLVPLNYRLSGEEIARIVADAGARVLFAGHGYHPLADRALAGPAAPLPVALHGQPPGWSSLDAFLDGHAPTPPALTGRADDAILQIYTSGTTGRPKGVIVIQAGWSAFSGVMNTAPWARPQPGDRRLCCMPLYHVAGAYPALVSH